MKIVLWVFFYVNIAIADEEHYYATEPQCRNVPLCPSDAEVCSRCNFSDSTLNITQTALPERYRFQVMGLNRCRVTILEIFVYYAGLDLCSSNLNKSEERRHTYELLKCQYINGMSRNDQILSSGDVNNETKPEISLIYYVDMMFRGCYRVKCSINGKITLKESFFVNNTFTENYFKELISDRNFTYLSDTIGHSSKLQLDFPVKFGQDHYEIYGEKCKNYEKGDSFCVTETDEPENWKRLSNLSYTPYGSELAVYNIKPGNYVLNFKLFTGWCKGGEIYKVCSWTKSISVLEPAGNYTIAKITSHQHTIWIIPLVCMIILALVVLRYFANRYILSKRNKPIIPLPTYPNTEQPERVQLKAIVLVYARDCDQLMNVMAELGKLLEERCGVKVYDIFNVSLMNSEIGRAPQEWANGMLHTPGVMFVLVKTRCGELLYEPVMSNDGNHFHLQAPLLPTHTHYRIPTYVDEFVNFLFRMVKEDAVLAEPYNKYFVVQIPSFSGDKQFGHVCPFRRYNLPSTTRLVSDLLGSNDCAYTPGEPEERLEAAVNILKTYVVENPNYVYSLLEDLQDVTEDSILI